MGREASLNYCFESRAANFDLIRYVLIIFTSFNMVDELEKTFPEFIGSWVKEGFSDKVVIIGFPYDQGARLAG